MVRAILSYEWTLLIAFLSYFTIGAGIGWKNSFGPYFCPFVIAQLTSCRSAAACGLYYASRMSVYVEIG